MDLHEAAEHFSGDHKSRRISKVGPGVGAGRERGMDRGYDRLAKVGFLVACSDKCVLAGSIGRLAGCGLET